MVPKNFDFMPLMLVSAKINHLDMQAMNFFAGLLLLLMPEENAFW
jgi:hypothetical protein